MNKIKTSIYSVLIWVFLILSCSQKDGTFATDEIKTIEKEVIAEFEKFENGLSNGDLETITKYYSDDPDFFWVENGAIAYPSGKAARNTIRNFYPSLKNMKFKSSDKKVIPINKSNVMFYVEYEQVLVFSSNQEININGAMTILMKKEGENWKFIVGHSSGKNENQNRG